MPVSTMSAPSSTPTLAGCQWPERFPEFVAAQVADGVNVRELLSTPYKWDVEYARFLAGVNIPDPKPGADLSEWLALHVIVSGKSRSGGSSERPIEYCDVEFGTDTAIDVTQLVADFTDFDYMPPQGEKFSFRSPMITAGGSVHVTVEATAHPEDKHGRKLVIWELEVAR